MVIPGHGRPFINVDAVTDASLRQLAYLRADPRRNALHAIRVLMKLKLLRQQVLSHEVLFAWPTQITPMPRLHTHFSAAQSMETLPDATIVALVKADATIVGRGRILNRD